MCILGQTRSHEIAWSSFKKNVIDELNADLAVCIGINRNYDTQNPYWQNAKYRWTIPDDGDLTGAADKIAALEMGEEGPKRWRRFMQSGYGYLFGGLEKADLNADWAHASGGILLLLRSFLIDCLKRDEILSKYEKIIVTRSDYIWLSPHPPFSIMKKNEIWVPDAETYGGFTDRHVCMPSDLAVAYMDIFRSMIRHPNIYLRALAKTQFNNLETLIRVSAELHEIDDNIILFPQVMYTARSAKDSPSLWSKGIFNDANGNIVKYRLEHMWASFFSDKIRSQKEWIDWVSVSPKEGNFIHNCLIVNKLGELLAITDAGSLRFLPPSLEEIKKLSGIVLMSGCHNNYALVARTFDGDSIGISGLSLSMHSNLGGYTFRDKKSTLGVRGGNLVRVENDSLIEPFNLVRANNILRMIKRLPRISEECLASP